MSDPAAIELADSVLQAMGGKKAWDYVRYFSWRNSEAKIFWDKQDSLARIEFDTEGELALVNLKSRSVRYARNNQELTEVELKPEKRDELLVYCQAEIKFFTLPFLFKSKGITLKYMGQDTVTTFGTCNVVELISADETGPLSKTFKLYVDKKENLVRKVQQFSKQQATTPEAQYFITEYSTIAGVKLWSEEGASRAPHQVAVFLSLPDYTFKDF